MGNGTSIGRVRGLGSAHEGTQHWLRQRFTAIGNLVLMTWLVASILLLPDLTYQSVIQWLGAPIPAVAMALLVISTFWHARLGLGVLIEDYVHEPGLKFAVVTALNLAVIVAVAYALFAIASIALITPSAAGAA